MKNLIEINIIYNFKREVNRVKSTIEKLSWYKKQGYLNIALPKNLSEQSSSEDVTNAISFEYLETDYEEFAQWMKEQWSELISRIKKLNEIPSFHLQDKYNIVLTKYGTGGSYYPETSEVIVNIKTKGKERVMETIIHEVIHMGIDHLIESHNVKHWYKERLVDLIMGRCFPGLDNMQQIEEDTNLVDEAFKRHFPDIEVITSEVGNIK